VTGCDSAVLTLFSPSIFACSQAHIPFFVIFSDSASEKSGNLNAAFLSAHHLLDVNLLFSKTSYAISA
jgi:hypothetical protein